MNKQVKELRAQIEFDTERLKTLELEIEVKQLQMQMIETAIKAKQASINLIEDSMTREIFRNERSVKYPPITVPDLLPIGAMDFIEVWER